MGGGGASQAIGSLGGTGRLGWGQTASQGAGNGQDLEGKQKVVLEVET